MRSLIVTAAVVVASSLTGGCSWGPERLCSGGEVLVLRSETEAGAYCGPADTTHRECPGGERVRRISDTGREDCVIDEVGHERDGLAPLGS